MIRLALLALALSSSAATASEIEGRATLGCRDIEIHESIGHLISDGDKVALEKLVQRTLLTGACGLMAVGTQVRIEKNSFPFACVAVRGEIEPCVWVRQRDVKP